MEVFARMEPGVGEPKRADQRLRASTVATLRREQESRQTIEIVDIAAGGCGFLSDWQIQPGTRIWLGLPGLESWPATVAWSVNCRGGLKFDRPLHPAIAERFAAQAETKNGAGNDA